MSVKTLQLDWRVGDFHIRNRATTFQYDNQPAYPSLSRYSNNLDGNVAPVFGGLSPNPAYPHLVADGTLSFLIKRRAPNRRLKWPRRSAVGPFCVATCPQCRHRKA